MVKPWQREILSIVRHIAQYFYPQGQTKVLNEGTATYVHCRIMNQAFHDPARLFTRLCGYPDRRKPGSWPEKG